MSDLSKVLVELRRPFMLEAVGFKLQALMPKNDPKRGQIVSYIDARLAADRLNHVVPGEWTDEYVPAPMGVGLECRLTVCGVPRRDVGFALDLDKDIGIKGLYSDAFKRAAVKFGVGASLYALPRCVVPVAQLANWNGKFHLFDDSPAMKVARDQYAAWLKGPGSAYFGEPLGHGDAEGAQGDIEVVVPPEAGEAVRRPQAFPERYVDTLRMAIHSKDPSGAYPDADQWASVVASATAANQKKGLVRELEAAATDLGLDVSLIKKRWTESREGATA